MFFAIDEFDADNNQFRAVEPAPVFSELPALV